MALTQSLLKPKKPYDIPYEARRGKGYFQVRGAVVLVEKLELVVQALFDPLGTPCKPQKGEG